MTTCLFSGVGATCVLKSPFNSSLDVDIFNNLNLSDHTLWLVSRYYEEGCERVFVPGIRLENYVPQAAVIDNEQIDDETGKNVRPTGKPGLFLYHAIQIMFRLKSA